MTTTTIAGNIFASFILVTPIRFSPITATSRFPTAENSFISAASSARNVRPPAKIAIAPSKTKIVSAENATPIPIEAPNITAAIKSSVDFKYKIL